MYLLLRVIGMAVIVPVAWQVRGKRIPSGTALRRMETTSAMALVALTTLSTLEFNGIASPLVLGVITILLARSAAATEGWKQSLGPTLLIASSYPGTLFLMTLGSRFIRSQFGDSVALGTFGFNLMFLYATAALAVIGGSLASTLHRQAREAKALGRYNLVRKIGRGGMGEVWLAKHHTLKRDVAIKILSPDKKQVDDLAIARFEREVHATTELTHPNTIRVFDYGVTDDGLFYYAMELLEGKDLAELVREEGPMDPERAARFIWQASRALAEAHHRGIVHRDLKPENLFVTTVGGEPDFLKVLDFGLAQIQHADVELTRAGWAVGTPTYIPPEVVLGKKADARSDVYALGTVLYFLLTGKTPFGARDLKRLLSANVHEAPRRPSERIDQDIPRRLENIIMTCLKKDPDDRFASGRSLSHALEAFLSSAAQVRAPRFSIRAQNETSRIVLREPSLSEVHQPQEDGEWGDVTQIDLQPAFL